MKDKILTGRIDGHNHFSAPDSIAATNSLVTGMTRSGKSYKLRTMAEAIHPHMPVWIVDPEDEFYTLREKYPFLLMGEGGDVVMTTQSARLVARSLLAWGVSAVLSLAALKEDQQHLWVYNFLDELMNRPRAEWRRAAIIIDEAHLFAPNSGHGKSDALAASRNLARRGLKRGLIPIWATQRLAALSVAVSSSAENMMVGRTTRSADQEQAAKLLGVNKAGKVALAAKLRNCKRGNFFAVGPAYGEDIVTLETIPAKTTHFSGRIGEDPEKLGLPKKLEHLRPELEKLANEIEVLKATAEETPEEELTRLRVVVQDMKGGGAAVTTEQFAALTAGIAERETLLAISEEEKDKRQTQIENMAAGIGAIQTKARKLEDTMIAAVSDMTRRIEAMRSDAASLAEEALNTLASGAPGPASAAAVSEDGTRSSISLTRREESLLRALREAEVMGMPELHRNHLAQMAGIAISGQFWNECGRLRKRGFITNRPDNHVALTPAGKVLIPAPAGPLTQDEMLKRLRKALGDDAYEVIEVVTRRRGLWMPLDDVREATRYGASSDKFRKIITKLREAEVIEMRAEDKHVRIAERILMKETKAA